MAFNIEMLATPLAMLAVPVVLSLIAKDALVFLSVAAVCAAGVIATIGVSGPREQWLVSGLIALAGMIFAVHGYQTRRTIRAVERLKNYLVEVRVATTSLRNTIEQERGATLKFRHDAAEDQASRD